MNIVQRRKLKRSADLKVLFFTFVGAFLLFFTAFTYFLPTLTPKVEIPALSEDQVFNSITSHDFRGKLDPRLHSLELQEQGVVVPEVQVQQENNSIETETDASVEASNTVEATNETGIREAGDMFYEEGLKAGSINELEEPGEPGEHGGQSKRGINGVPPRPKPITYRVANGSAPVPSVFEAKVIIGNFTNLYDAQMASNALTDFNFEPVLKESNGFYLLQLGAFTNIEKARGLVQQLRRHNFDARIIYE